MLSPLTRHTVPPLLDAFAEAIHDAGFNVPVDDYLLPRGATI